MNNYPFTIFGITFAISLQGIIANIIISFLVAEFFMWWKRANRPHISSLLCFPVFQLSIIAHEFGHGLTNLICFGELPRQFRFVFLGGYTLFSKKLSDMAPITAVIESLGGPIVSAVIVIMGFLVVRYSKQIILKNIFAFTFALNIFMMLMSVHPVFGDGRNIIIDSFRSSMSVYDALNIANQIGFYASMATVFILFPLSIWYLICKRPAK